MFNRSSVVILKCIQIDLRLGKITDTIDQITMNDVGLHTEEEAKQMYPDDGTMTFR